MNRTGQCRQPQATDWIGVFDSGVGGVSILRELLRHLPEERVAYFGDTARLPYGSRPLEEVRRFSLAIAGALIRLPAKLIVVACNTASAASLRELRSAFPHIPFVGMEPAVKPAAAESHTKKVGVLATRATFQGELFESVVERFAHGVEVVPQPCPGLAEFIEANPPDHPDLIPLLARFILPLREQGVDTLVLACTHYPLVKEAIAKVAGPGLRIIDPSPAIARRAQSLLTERDLLAPTGGGSLVVAASGDTASFSRAVSSHLGRDIQAIRTLC